MTPYCSIDDVRMHLPEVTAEIVQDATVMYYINEATAEIDDTLRDVYVVPFTPTPNVIGSLCARMTAYYILQVFPDATVDDDLERLSNDISAMIDAYKTGAKQLAPSYRRAINDITTVYTVSASSTLEDIIESRDR